MPRGRSYGRRRRRRGADLKSYILDKLAEGGKRAASEAFEYAREKGKEFYDYETRPAKRQKTSAPKGTLKRHGVGGGHRVRAKSVSYKRKPRSLKKRVSQLEKKSPPTSKHWELENEYFVHSHNADNFVQYFEVPMVEVQKIRVAVAKLNGTGSDPLDNSKTKVKNFRATYILKNARTANCHVEYQLFRCASNCTDSVLDELHENLTQRGAAPSSAITAADAATSTTSAQPRRLVLGPTEQHLPVWSQNRRLQHWKPVGKIQKASIGPGDSIVVSHNTGALTYSEAKFDDKDTGDVFLANWDYQLIVMQTGEIGHDSSNTLNIGISRAQLDCHRIQSVHVFIQDGNGTDTISSTEHDDTTGITGIEIADEHAAAMVGADV